MEGTLRACKILEAPDDRVDERAGESSPAAQAGDQGKLERFCGEHFAGKKILGIHFRGRDKSEEAPRASLNCIRETIENYLRANRDIDGLFVASDEPVFREQISGLFPGLELITYESEKAGYQADFDASNYKKGEAALMDCLLLSRCDVVIRTTSFLSAWASIFNPKLPIVLVNRPYPDKLWFPESQLISRSMDEYLPGAAVVAQSLPARARLR